MPFFTGSGRWSGKMAGNNNGQEIDYSVISNRKHFEAHGEPEVRIESNNVSLEIPRYDDNQTKKKEEKAKENAEEENSPKRQLSVKQRKFSFKKGKVSFVEKPVLTADWGVQANNILLEIEGKEIEVDENCLLKNCLHFSRIFEDVSLHPDSQYIERDEQEDEYDDEQEDNYEEEDEEQDEHENPLGMISFATVESLVNYISKIEMDLKVSDGNVLDFQQTARLLNIPVVEKICQKFVEKNINNQNCSKRFQLADSFLGWTSSSKILQEYIEENITGILEENNDDLYQLNEHQMKRLMSSSDLNLKNEDQGLQLVLDWVQQDLQERRSKLHPLLECIQFTCIENTTILEDLLQSDLIQQDELSVELVTQGLEYFSHSNSDKISYWSKQQKPSRWPQILVCLSYAEKILEYFDFSTQEWGILTEKPDWVFGAELVSCASKLYTVGGVSSRQVDRYDPETDNWAGGSYPSLQKARLAHGACVVHDALGGTIYAAGGSPQVGGQGHRDIERISPEVPPSCECPYCGPFQHLKWKLEDFEMESPRTFTAMASIGENIYLVGGDEAPDSLTSSLEIFNTKTKQWKKSSNTASKRDSCRLAVLGESLLAIGGHNNNTNQFLNTCEKYCTTTQKWSNFPKLKVARRSPGVVTYRRQVYCVGGMGSKKDLSTIEFYSPSTKKWTILPNQMKSLSGWISAAVLQKPVWLINKHKLNHS